VLITSFARNFEKVNSILHRLDFYAPFYSMQRKEKSLLSAIFTEAHGFYSHIHQKKRE
jgi:hypothetical protein